MVTASTTPVRGACGLGKRAAKWLLAGALVVWGGLAQAGAAPPTVAQMLSFKPKQEGVVVSTPDADKQAACKVELVKGAKKGSGWVLKDAQGNVLRNFFDSNDDNKIDVWSYYKDGREVYREIDTTYSGRPDQYRWLNDGGMKWGVDETKDGKIKHWKAISPEEVSQEIVQALAARDVGRLQALLISETEIKTLDLPAAEAERIRKALKEVPAKFNDAVAKLPPLVKPVWRSLTTSAPACVPAEQSGSRLDLIKYAGGTIMFDIPGKSESERQNLFVQTGDLLQVGAAWRLAGSPFPGDAPPAEQRPPEGPGVVELGANPKLKEAFDELEKLDKLPVPPEAPAAAAHHLRRADVVEKIITECKAEERDPFIRQLADSLSSAAQVSPAADKAASARLQRLVDQLAKAVPGSNLAAYAAYRQYQAEYSQKFNAKDANVTKIQAEWVETLAKFVSAYPKAEDTADALLQLGMVCEFLNEDVKAKNWYAQLARNFPEGKQAAKARGAAARLDLDGKPLRLAGPTLKDANVTFDVEQLKGKYVVVYYWASWNSQCVGDFAKLKLIAEANKDVALLCVNLDNTPEEAAAFLAKAPAPGTHLYQAGGLEGKLATDYGVMVLPSLFLVGRDGKVLSHTVQISGLEEEIKKAEKK